MTMKTVAGWLAATAMVAIVGCTTQPRDQDTIDQEPATRANEQSLELRAEDDLQVAVRRALSLEGLDNVTVQIQGQRVALAGWVYSPEDKVLAHNVAQSVHGVADVDFAAIRVG